MKQDRDKEVYNSKIYIYCKNHALLLYTFYPFINSSISSAPSLPRFRCCDRAASQVFSPDVRYIQATRSACPMQALLHLLCLVLL